MHNLFNTVQNNVEKTTATTTGSPDLFFTNKAYRNLILNKLQT
jgi:hypothetical protein